MFTLISNKMKYSAIALVALFAMSMMATAGERVQKIGNWNFSSGKITLDLKGGPPPEYGSLISLSNDDDGLLQVSCSNKQYQLFLSYFADAAPPATNNPRIHIEVDNNYWIEGDAKIDDAGDIGGAHWILLTSDIGPKNLDLLSKVRTALKVTVPGGRQLRFIANGTRDAFIALHDAC